MQITQIKDGLIRYIENEMLPKMSGLRKVGMATYVTLAAESAAETVRKYAEHPAIQMLGVVHGEEVDMGRLFGAIMANYGERQTISLPIFGDFTLSRSDIERLRETIGY